VSIPTVWQCAGVYKSLYKNPDACREVLKQKLDNPKPAEWFEKHTVVLAEDFAKRAASQ